MFLIQKPQHKTPYYLLLAFFFCLLCSAISWADNLKTETHHLQTVTHQITQLQAHINQAKTQRSTVYHQLKNTEMAIGHLSHKIHQTHQALTEKKHTLQSLQTKQAQYQSKLETQKALLIQQLQAAYMLGREPKAKILLNQEDPNTIGRQLTYYQYMNQARLQAMHTIQKLSEQISQNASVIQDQTQKYQHVQNTLSAQKQDLLHQQKTRKTILHTINQDIHQKQTTLQKLYADQKALSDVINELNAEKMYAYAPGTTFNQMQGKLHHPILGGKIIQSFGQPIAGGRLHATGILIATKLDTPVHAVFPGQVIYANWLRGFGLLTIIQHGKDYMTLYARNQSLYVKTGETVEAGQVIATAGNSGGYENTALYFEIRYQGKPLNPNRWLG